MGKKQNFTVTISSALQYIIARLLIWCTTFTSIAILSEKCWTICDWGKNIALENTLYFTTLLMRHQQFSKNLIFGDMSPLHSTGSMNELTYIKHQWLATNWSTVSALHNPTVLYSAQCAIVLLSTKESKMEQKPAMFLIYTFFPTSLKGRGYLAIHFKIVCVRP